jgi:phage repressor protein C with HTH and peptisase S24 domain
LNGIHIKEKREALNLSQQELADIAGVSLHTVFRAEKGTIIQSKNLQAIAAALNTTVAYLMGETEEAGKKTAGPRFDSNTGPRVPHKWIPILDQEACAGRGFSYEVVIAEAKQWVPWALDRMGGAAEPKTPFLLPVNSDSMEGIGIKNGSLVLVNPNVEVLNGNPAYVEWCGARSIKGFMRYPDGRVELRPANPNYQTIHISANDALSDNFCIIGKIVRWIDNGVPDNVM